ncbi:TPA: restriction endonuclease subunit S [Klebsiella pneumoniae]|nr:restriction endonuclease subunit S [Klebsiella pneumoniae]
MSELSYLEKMLDGVEVEWRNLGDTSLFEIANNGRKPVKASLRIAGETPYYGANNIQDYVDGYTHDGEYVLIAEDGSASLENYSIQYATGKFWANNHVHVVRGKERVHSRFLYHYLCIVNFLPFLTGGGRAKLTKGQLIEIPVPIPCPNNPEKSLAIQSEIVRILDKFTALTAELTAELTARKKQYNYYRDQLLSFEEGEVEWKALGEIAAYSKSRISFDKLDENNYVGVDNLLQNRAGKMQSNYVPTSGNLTEFREGDILIGNIRPYLKKIWQADSTGGTNGDVLVIRSCHESILPRYLYQILADENFFEYNMQHAKGAKMPRGNKDAIMKYRLPIPSLNEQTRIVSVLDKFDTLTNSISEGLPREIELRQKQYEYYRDLLFSFPKPETAQNTH